MDSMLKSMQNAGDNLEKDGTLTEEAKEKFPRPETNEDVYKMLSSTSTFNGGGGNNSSLLLMFLFGMLLSSPGFGGPSLHELELYRLLNTEKSENDKIDKTEKGDQ